MPFQETVMKKIMVLVLLLIARPALAVNWRYVVYLGDTVIYDGPSPPFDVEMAYPDPSQTAPIINVGDEHRGRLLNEVEYADELIQPHLIIIPPAGNIRRSTANPVSSMGVPLQFGSY